jgi:hypothetical protein
MKTRGLFSKNGPRKGILLSQPLDSDWAAEIRWEEEEKRGVTTGVGGGDGGAAIAAVESSPALPKKALRCMVH